MKTYNKVYENVFSTDQPKVSVRLNLNAISVTNMSVDEYISLFKGFLTDFYSRLFDDCVRLSWLRRKFTIDGRKTILPMGKNSLRLHVSFVKLLRRNVGKDIQIITRGKFFSKLEMYLDEFFPGFDEGDPFKNPDYYKFPFKNITVEYLMPVYQMDDRIGLLKIADEQAMSYAVFLDYVINHAYSINEEIGRDRYQIKHNLDRKDFPFYIRDTDKELQSKRKKKK